jgi:hypothetical protein
LNPKIGDALLIIGTIFVGLEFLSVFFGVNYQTIGLSATIVTPFDIAIYRITTTLIGSFLVVRGYHTQHGKVKQEFLVNFGRQLDELFGRFWLETLAQSIIGTYLIWSFFVITTSHFTVFGDVGLIPVLYLAFLAILMVGDILVARSVLDLVV